ncbi:MAG: ABC transporter substrate-binding protein, partial [Candidatus Heimdallarchaeota archaeon]
QSSIDDWFGWGKSFSASNGEVYSFPSMDNAFKFLNYSHVSDNTLAVNQLVSGKLDIVTELDATPEVRQKINSHNNISFSTVEILGGDYISMNIQGDYPEYFGGPGNFPLSQVWFRQAVSHAINRTHLENVAYNNYGYPLQARTTWFPDWIENDSPDLDTTDYYDFYQGKEKASSLLHEAGYRPLTFSEEPTNRFGWGVYANETQVGGVEQVRGRHFKLLCSSNLEYSVKRAEAIKNDLEQVGIFVEIDASPDWRTYLASLYSGDPGGSYNTTGGQPDPNFTGPEWDFAVVAAVALPYDTPAAYCATIQFAWWYYGWWSGENSWCNENYEINRAKIFGGEPGLGQLGIPPPADMPPSGYSPPVWENDDTQYIEACEQAGFEMSKELPYAPLTNYRHVYAINNHVKNFQMNGAYMFIIAYSYWSTEDGGSSTGVYGALTIMIIVLFLLTIPPQHNKKRKRGS